MRRSAVAAGVAALALAFAGCGDDETTSPAETGTTDAIENAPPSPADESGEYNDPAAGDESGDGSGGVSPEDQPGGAGDEANDPIEPGGGTGSGAGGGSGGGGSNSGGVGPSPTDNFDQFCEENPRACE